MKVIEKEPVIRFLKKNHFGYYGGLSIPNIKDNTDSIEPIAIVAFILSKMHEINADEKDMYKDIILRQKSKTGAFFTINRKTSVWATAQACLALNELGCDVSKYENSLMWLCESQNKDGGWSYDGIFQNSSIIHSFYTVIILKKFRSIYKVVDNVLVRNVK